ncbi:DUF1659 domain-containing protein [Desulfotomaculum sp. 1211_IL3151]|uniref:DUF1659 domain-containing protein n=1 Tax=Desulfotomaculum sp. 1211_IL3151 TaxID=3084055 RepID=UPI002FD93F72
MPVLKEPFGCSMKMRYQQGVNHNGDPVFVNRSYSKIKVTATDQDIYDVAAVLNSLQNSPLLAVYRQDDSELINQ